MAAAPAVARAQTTPSLADPLIDFLDASSGRFGDEGSTIPATLDAMDARRRAWDTDVLRTEQQLTARLRGASLSDAAQMHTTLGVAYLRRGRRADAIQQLRAAAKAAPSSTAIESLLALALDGGGDHRAARTAWRAAYESEPHDLVAAYWYARRLLDAASANPPATARAPVDTIVAAALAAMPTTAPWRMPTAAALNDQAVDDPVFAPARYAGAMQAFLAGDYERAVAALKRAAARDPLVADSAVRVPAAADGIRALRAGDIPSALRRLRDAAAAAPQSSEVHRALAMALWADQQTTAARDEFDAAIRLRRDNERAYLALADMTAEAGDTAATVMVLERAVTAIPRSGQAAWRLAKIAEDAHHNADALAHYRACASAPPVVGAGVVWAAIAWLEHQGSDFKAEVRDDARWVALQPNAADAHRKLADAYAAIGRTTAALVERAAAALESPQDAVAYAALAQALMAAGRDADVEQAARHAIAIDPENKEARYELSVALARQGQHDESARQLEVFRRLQRQSLEAERHTYTVSALRRQAQVAADPHTRAAAWQRVIAAAKPTADNEQKLGNALAAAGRLDEAIAAYRLAVALGKKPSAFRALIALYEKAGRHVEADLTRAAFDRAKRERIRRLAAAR